MKRHTYDIAVVTLEISRERGGYDAGEKIANPVVTAWFGRAAQWTSQQCGRPSTVILACVVIVVWAVTGPIFNFSDTWQLIINTGTTIITFLMVFLIHYWLRVFAFLLTYFPQPISAGACGPAHP